MMGWWIAALEIVSMFGGYAYCFYCIGFRWSRVRSKYGILDLHFWAGYVVFSFSLASTLVEFATLVLWRE